MKYVRLVVLAAAAVGYTAYRNSETLPLPAPAPLVAPHVSIASAAGSLPAEDRKAIAEMYMGLSRAVAANPEVDPVFTSTADIRHGHRAALLCVYRGLLDAQPGAAPGLKEAIEGAMDMGVGREDVPLNPSLQQQAAKTFVDIATSLNAAR